ncbi:UNVERIFIED_CONTAM: hypothetical protein Slati_3736400 [Sesamum latifolium]|uniref:Uncharacterized protein n=1 Tax=Sesamum latifolium TaxID=2727402 RepID=A0AAW2U490_9LAMI
MSSNSAQHGQHRGDAWSRNRCPIPSRTDPKPNSRNNSPSLYVPWTVARRPPMVTGSPDQGLIKSY